jgi:hypothetical protein
MPPLSLYVFMAFTGIPFPYYLCVYVCIYIYMCVLCSERYFTESKLLLSFFSSFLVSLGVKGYTRWHRTHLVGLLWASDQSVAETSTWQHTTLTKDRHPCPRRDSNPQVSAAANPTPRQRGHLDRPELLLHLPVSSFHMIILIQIRCVSSIVWHLPCRYCGVFFCKIHKTFTHIPRSNIAQIKNSALCSECVSCVCWLHIFFSIKRLQVYHYYLSHLSMSSVQLATFPVYLTV